MIKLIGNKEGLIPSDVKDISDPENHYWIEGHTYDVPKKFYINNDIFEIIEERKSKKIEVKNEH